MHNKASLILALAIMICSGGAVYAASGWPWKAALFPMVIGIPLFFMAAAEAAWALFGSASAARAMDFQISSHVPERTAVRRTLLATAWMLGLFAVIALVGFPVAVPLFVLLYLRLQGREPWLFSALFSAAVAAVFYAIFKWLLNLPFPAGWLQGLAGF
jgi:hypothetical protein